MHFMRSRLAVAAVLLVAITLTGCARDATVVTPPAPSDDSAAVHAVLADVADAFNRSDLDAAMQVFTEDAVISGQGEPDVVGAAAIRSMYEAAIAQVGMKVVFHTEEVHTVGDLAFERGTYTVDLTDKASGAPIGRMDNRHVHVMRKGADGKWRTWRMMVNSPRGGAPAPLPPAVN